MFVEKILSPDRFTSESDDFCLECHRRESLGRSHPRGTVAPRATPPLKVPEPFRLSSDGRLMCLTCHAAHGPYLSATPSFPGQGRYDESATGGGSGYKTYYLRRVGPGEGFAALCHACHGELR